MKQVRVPITRPGLGYTPTTMLGLSGQNSTNRALKAVMCLSASAYIRVRRCFMPINQNVEAEGRQDRNSENTCYYIPTPADRI